MRWIKPVLRNSISALLSAEVRLQSPESLDALRHAMLALLGEAGAEINPRLRHKLQYTDSAETLWFARAELVTVLSLARGEAAARAAVEDLSHLFAGLVPSAMLRCARMPRS